jgi:hypothetical protein
MATNKAVVKRMKAFIEKHTGEPWPWIEDRIRSRWPVSANNSVTLRALERYYTALICDIGRDRPARRARSQRLKEGGR